MDSAFLAENARSVIVLRPAIALARPELANLAKLVEATLDILPKESPHIADFRQITVVVPGTNIPSGPREVAVSQWVEPVPATFLKQCTADRGYAVKESDGKKMYVHPQGGAILLYDERTLIEAGSEQAMGAYLGEKRGVLPKWLPAKSWESFRSDHLVIATGAAEIRENMKLLMENAPPLLTAPFLAVAPLWQDAECLAVGARLDDRLAVHAWLTAKNADSAVKARGTAEALKTLLQIAAKNARALFETAQQPNPLALALLDLADRLLESMKFQQEGSAVQLSTSVELDATRLGTLMPQVTAARDAGQRMQTVNNLKQIMLALHNYLDARKHFPPAVLYGPDGKTPHSWRVAVLPYLGRQDLYAQYQFDEPWDGPNNRKLLDKMPDVFRSPKDPPDSTNCAYFALVGPGTMFDGPSGTRAADVRDGFANTLMLFEAKRDIPWTKPEDLPYDPDKPLPALGGYFEGIFNVAMADGSVRSLPTTAPEKVLSRRSPRLAASR